MTAFINDLIGSAHALIQAPMAGAQDAQLALAVSRAGGLGSLAAAMWSADQLRQQLTLIGEEFGQLVNVNFMCHEAPPPDAACEQAWRAVLAPYFAECGIDPLALTATPVRAPFSQVMCDVLAQYRPRVVSFHFGLPAADLLAQLRSWGAIVLSSATTLAEGLWLQERGVDAVIAQGLEAGGHRGMFLTHDVGTHRGTLPLVTELAQSLRVPVIAAGGISDAGGVAAAIAAGASAVQVGTAFLMCPQATTSAVHRAALQMRPAGATALTNLFTGRAARGVVNRLMRELGPVHNGAPRFPLAGNALAPLRQYAERQGRADFSPLWAGQNFADCREVDAGDLSRELVQGLYGG